MRILRINKKIIYPELSYKMYGLLFAVHKNLGRYRNEKQYMDAFEKLLIDEGDKLYSGKSSATVFHRREKQKEYSGFYYRG